MSEDCCYYVYLLLDPRKFYIPFYAGKGKGKRWTQHLKPILEGRNYLKNSVIKKIRNSGMEPVVTFWAENLTEEQAFKLEAELISKFGRRNKNTGILTNLTDGGDGVRGFTYSDEQIARRKELSQGENNPMFGKTHTPEVRKLLSEINKQRFLEGKQTRHSPEWRKYLTENNAGGKATSKPIHQIDQDGNVINTWSSATQAANALNLSKGNIGFVANKLINRRCGGYWWRYVGSPDIVDNKLTNFQELELKLNTPAHSKQVSQIDPINGKIVRVWNSFQEAVNHFENVEYGTLWAAAKYKRLCAGYFWQKL